MTTTTEIAQRIRLALSEQERSIAWLASKTGIADKTLRRRLVRPDDFTLAELAAVGRAVGVELEAFFPQATPSLELEAVAS